MPDLDELSSVRTLAAIQANDKLPVSDTSAGRATVRAVPAALVAQGFTHAWRIDYDHPSLSGAGANTTDVEIKLLLLPAYSAVEKVRVVVTTAFTVTALNLFVGRTSATSAFITTFDASAKTVKQNTGEAIDTPLEFYLPGATDTEYLVITFDPGAHLHDLGAGSVVILAGITEIAAYANIAEAKLSA